MFERFTERARQVVVLAQDAARKEDESEIGSEYLLLGLLREKEGLAARTLESLGVDEAKVLTTIRARPRKADEHAPAAGQIPFTSDTQTALELALREALSLGHNYIGTEHVLLGLIRRDAARGAQVLNEMGVSEQNVRCEVMRRLVGPRRTRTASDRMEFGRRAYGVYVHALAVEKANHRYTGPDAVAWDFLPLGVQKAWLAVGDARAHEHELAV